MFELIDSIPNVLWNTIPVYKGKKSIFQVIVGLKAGLPQLNKVDYNV